MCETSKPTLSHGLLVFFCLFDFLFIYNHSLLILSPTYALLLLLPFLRQPKPPSPSSLRTVQYVCVPICHCLSSCLLSCCLSFVLPRVSSLVPVFPVLSICLSLSQLFHLFHYFLLNHLHYFASCSLTFSASQQTF